MNIITIFFVIGIGLLAGVLSGSFGVGGGIIMVPLLAMIGFSQQEAQGTSLAAMLPPVTLLAVINYSKAGYINWTYAALLSIVVILGGYFGSKIAINTQEKILRQLFGILLIIAGGKMIFK